MAVMGRGAQSFAFFAKGGFQKGGASAGRKEKATKKDSEASKSTKGREQESTCWDSATTITTASRVSCSGRLKLKDSRDPGPATKPQISGPEPYQGNPFV